MIELARAGRPKYSRTLHVFDLTWRHFTNRATGASPQARAKDQESAGTLCARLQGWTVRAAGEPPSLFKASKGPRCVASELD